MLNIDEFDLDLNYEEYLINSLFRIDEFVPAYEIKNKNFEDLSDDFQRNHNVTNWAFDKVNGKCNKKILIFCDSYFGSSHVDKFFINHYGEVIMIHYANLKDLNSYVEEYNPDVIIIETAERAFNRNGGRSDSFQWTQEWYSKVLTTT